MSQANIDTIAEVYKAFESHDFGVIPKLFDPDLVITQTTELPWGGRYSGHEGATTFLTTLLSHIDSRVVVGSLFAAGEDVVQVGRTQGKTVAAGVAFDIPEVHIWHLRSGRVVRYDAYIDTPAMLEALGANG